MPIEAPGTGGRQEIADRRILRLALGTALALWISQVGGWSLSYIAPIFALVLLAGPRPCPPLKAGIAILALIAAAVYGGMLILPMLMHQPAVGILILTLALMHTFYFSARGGNAAVGTLMTIGLTLTITVGSVSIDAVLVVAQSVLTGAAVGLVAVWTAHALIPDRVAPAAAAPPPETPKPSPETARRDAFRSLAIVLPVAILLLFSSDSASSLAVMIKITSMTQQVGKAGTRSAAASLLMSTLLGGLAACAGWFVLAIWPLLTIYVLLIALAGLLMGRRIFAGEGVHTQAPTWTYAYLTMIVILAPAVLDSIGGSSAGVAFIDRLLMFAGATLYGVAAVAVFDSIWPQGKSAPARA